MIILREATIHDISILFDWRNDIEVRKSSFNVNKVEQEEHLLWLETKLNSSDSNIYILEDDNKPIGVIRLDNIGNNYKLINFSIDEKYRGKGYASQLLELIKIHYLDYTLVGEVKKDNIGSIKAFQKAGYFMKEELEYLVFYSKV